ncbi:actin-like ATPase domain-containing protein [Teratosphaeria nubilosa]|uniref:Actin-like ATPase domain-containing protein n=1 Tax=Teratosphaeria nubilosa TaxID=161662 RepID=A0A6G1L559_9PEZI|nr:actin-like ATPase domain-containing protein [Teratosphaeria nubilosa]
MNGDRVPPKSTHSRNASTATTRTTTSVSTSANQTSSPQTPSSDAPPPKREDRLIVGVDFGTTYSGVAAVYTANPDDIDIIKTWPGGNGITSDKVPTEISYTAPAEPATPPTPPATTSTPGTSVAQESEDRATQPERAIKWGFQHRPEEQRLRCIKLFLDRNQRLPHFVSPLETAAQLRTCNRTVMDAVSDYLTKLYEHTIETLTRRYGDAFMQTTKLEFVLTVPAVWSDAAKNATLQAAERAGMGTRREVVLVSEPEAAAVYTLKNVQPSGLKVGDNFIVCDAGGGTVDLIAYRVTSLSPLRVEESAVGTGGLCGSAFLNYRFEDHVRERIGKERFDNMKEKKPKTFNMGLRYFEEFVKRNFNEDEHVEINVPFPGLPDDEEAGLDSGFLIMSAEQIKGIFEPVVNKVLELVEGQVNAIRSKGETERAIKGIILVGGFGQSNYLYMKLKKHFNPSPPPPYTETPTHSASTSASSLTLPQNVEVLQPMHAWTAVVRGAVLRGLEGGMVEKRQSRLHYGTSYATVFDEGKHPIQDRYWSPLWERWMVSDRMQWHIAKGTPISSSTPISFHYTRNFRPAQSLIVEDELIACSSDSAPDAYTPSSNQSLINVCTLTTDLNSVPKSLFTRLTTTKGVEFDNLDFELHMKIESARLVFELRVDGVRYGDVKAEFN